MSAVSAGYPRVRRVLKAVLLAAALLVLAELILGWLYPWRYPVPLPYQREANAEWCSSLSDGAPRMQARPQLFDPSPPSDLFRVVVVGSSAVFGQNFTMFQAFPWRLQRLLQRQGVKAEVLNLGRCALDSGDHLAALRSALPVLKPAVVVIYTGNNEFHRLRAYAELNPDWNPEMETARMGLQRIGLYRALRAWTGRDTDRGPAITGADVKGTGPAQGPGWSAHSVLPELRDMRARVTDPARRLATDQYVHNLEEMAATARGQGAKVVVCTVADNELSRPEFGEPSDPAARASFEKAESLMRQGAVDQARAYLLEQLRERPQDAWLHYELGLAAQASGDYGAARRSLSMAMELDPRPTRALPSFGAAVRRLAERRQLLVCDVEELLRVARPDGLLGGDLFCDNCHFGIAGMERVATALAKCISDGGLLPPAASSRASSGAPFDPLDLEQTRLDSRLMEREGTRILAGQPPAEGAATQRLAEMLGEALPPSDTARGMVLRGHLLYGSGRFAEAAASYRRAIGTGLATPVVWRDLGHACVADNDAKGALDAYQRFESEGGNDPVIHMWIRLLQSPPSRPAPFAP